MKSHGMIGLFPGVGGRENGTQHGEVLKGASRFSAAPPESPGPHSIFTTSSRVRSLHLQLYAIIEHALGLCQDERIKEPVGAGCISPRDAFGPQSLREPQMVSQFKLVTSVRFTQSQDRDRNIRIRMQTLEFLSC